MRSGGSGQGPADAPVGRTPQTEPRSLALGRPLLLRRRIFSTGTVPALRTSGWSASTKRADKRLRHDGSEKAACGLMRRRGVVEPTRPRLPVHR